jgi:DnaK suppressor protein
MGNLSKEQVAQIGKALAERRGTLRAEIGQGLLRAAGDRYRDVAGMVTDSADEAVADLVADLDIAEIERDVQELREVETAIARARSPEFGDCVECGEPVGFERLKAHPSAARCIKCQERHERSHARHGTSSL